MSDELKIGDRLKDNDPRVVNRILVVIEILPNGVVASDSIGNKRTYLRHRIHTDGKPRKSGLSLIKEQR